jgi:hypothetical protein
VKKKEHKDEIWEYTLQLVRHHFGKCPKDG